MHKNKFIVALALFCSMGAIRVLAQANTATPRITAAVDNSKLVILSGTVHPLARQQNDRGLAPADLPMAHMLLVLQRSPQQEAALESLLAAQQDRNSPSYHQWLTPAQFGAEFGPADQDIQTITAWLQSQGFTVNNVPAGRTVIDFSGTAATIQTAFHTAIHQYVLPNGEQHWANSTNIEIPAALAQVVAGVRSLNNFFPKPQHHAAVRPAFTFPFGGSCGPSTNNCFDVTPADLATIYNVPATTWTGANETIAVVSDSDISATDLDQFRSTFGLPAMTDNAPSSSAPTCTVGTPCFVQFVPPTSTNPGIQCPDPGQTFSPAGCPNPSNTNEVEADIDTEWAGAAAPGANIWLVSSADSGATFGGEASATYVVNCPTVNGGCPVAVPASILSDSFGSCEFTLGSAGNTFYSSTWSQAETEGITVVIASGDSGSAGCDPNDGTPPQTAINGLAVNGAASTPNDVAVGGTDFNQATNPTQFWGASASNSNTGESALGYIPETTWNDSCTNALFGNNPIANCNSGGGGSPSFVFILGGGGGPSTCATFTGAACSAGYAKPAWQTSVTPADGVRDIPDISLFAGNGFVGSAYIMCEADMPGAAGAPGQEGAACSLSQPPTSTGTTSSFEEVGGTSVAAQAFAGITALIDQQAGANQGNINPNLYTLANTTGNTCSSAASPASSCVFYDVTSGTNSQPCQTATPNCTTSGNPVGVLETGGQVAYNAAANYDLATGLGSVNVENLLCKWTLTPVFTCTSSALQASASTVTVGTSVTFTATVTAQSGVTKPTGTVKFLDGATNIGSGTLNGSGVATLAISTLVVGPHSVTAAYQGASTFAPSTSAAVAVQVNALPTPDFSVSAAPSSQSVAPGASTSYTLTLTPVNGFNQAVTVSCSGAPTEATCTPASTSVTLNGTSASTDTINVTTTAPSAVAFRVTPPFSGWGTLAMVASFGLFLLIADGFIRRSMSARRWVATAAFAVLIVFAVAGCGGGNKSSTTPSGGTPAGTYTLTITGTSGSTTHTTTVSLVVQ